MESYVDKSIIVFDEYGNGIYSIEWPFNQEQIDNLVSMNTNYAILDRDMPNSYWMDLDHPDKQCHLRQTVQTNPTVNKNKVKADGVDEAIISDLPDPCILSINGIPQSVEGGIFSLSATDSQTVYITLGGTHKSEYLVVDFLDINDVRNNKWEELKQIREEKLSTAATSFGVFDSNAEAKANINGIVTGILALQGMGLTPPNVNFRMHDNTTAVFTPAQFVQASLAVSVYLESVYVRSWALKEHLEGIADIDDIEALEWDTDIG